MRVCAILTNTIFECFIFLGKDFLNLWIPNQDIETIYILTLLSIAPCIIEGVTYPLYSVYMLTTRIIVPTLITIVSGLINVVSMYLLLRYTSYGVYAVVLTTAVIVTLIHFITPIYSCICLKIKLSTFVPTILLVGAALVVNTLILLFINSLLGKAIDLTEFITKGIVMGTVCLGIQIIFLFYPEIIQKCK